MKKNILFAAILAMTASTMTTLLSSCSKDIDANNAEVVNHPVQSEGYAQVRFRIGIDVDVTASIDSDGYETARASTYPSTRSSLVASGKELTDLYILDYDKDTGDLLQLIHQVSTQDDFAEPSFSLAYGTHTIKVIATRSLSSTLLDAESVAVPDNFVAGATAKDPSVLTSSRTSDTFAQQKDITIATGKAPNVNITLDRIVAKLTLRDTGTLPDDCSTISFTLQEHKGISLPSLYVIEAEKNEHVCDVSGKAGTEHYSVSCFLLCPEQGYTTDISFVVGRKGSDKPYATFTVPDVPLERNKITNVSGSFYNHSQSFVCRVNDKWQEATNDVDF